MSGLPYIIGRSHGSIWNTFFINHGTQIYNHNGWRRSSRRNQQHTVGYRSPWKISALRVFLDICTKHHNSNSNTHYSFYTGRYELQVSAGEQYWVTVKSFNWLNSWSMFWQLINWLLKIITIISVANQRKPNTSQLQSIKINQSCWGYRTCIHLLLFYESILYYDFYWVSLGIQVHKCMVGMSDWSIKIISMNLHS